MTGCFNFMYSVGKLLVDEKIEWKDTWTEERKKHVESHQLTLIIKYYCDQ